MFKRLKKEIFFLFKLFRGSLSFKQLVDYAKYRFFGGIILSNLNPGNCEIRDDISMHILCQDEDLYMIEWSVLSFLKHSGFCPRIIIHDDGSMSDKSVSVLENKFKNLKVLRKKEARELLKNSPHFKNNIKTFSEGGHKVLIQLIDILLLSDSEKVILMDGDVLFFKKPHELISFVNGGSEYDAMVSRQNGGYDLMVKDDYADKYRIYENKASEMNPGLIAYKRGSVSFDKLEEFLGNTRRNHDDYFLAMTGWACLLSQINYVFFPGDKYIIKGRPDHSTVMKHFTNPRRQEFYSYGIDLSLNKK